MSIRDKIERHLYTLCEEIGARPAGSAANRAAVDYVCAEFESSGLTVQRQEFDCMDWKEGGGSSLTINGRSVSVKPAPYSLGCDVTSEIVLAGDLAQLRDTPAAGKIVVLHGALAAEPLMPKSFVFWNPDEHKEIISLLEKGRPLAVLTVSLAPESFVPVIEDGDFEVPCGIVLPGDLEKLVHGAEAHLVLNAERQPAKGANVIAACGSGEHKVCFSAHIDTKAGTPGALDDASGVAVLLAMASELTEKEYSCRIEFVLFNGEDYYSNAGEMAYLGSFLSSPSEYACAFNIDGVGLRDSKITYSFYECPEKLSRKLTGLAESTGGFEEIEPWPQGDHTLFSISGVPAVALTSRGIFALMEKVIHTENDRMELIDAAKLELLVQFLLSSL